MTAALQHENDLEARSGGATDEVELAAFFSLFLALLLGAVLLSNKVAHHWHSKCVPEAAAVIALGIVASVGCRLSSGLIAKTLMGFDATTFFVMLLPPIIFNSGYTMKRRYFFENIRSILWFAIVGTFVSTVVVGVLLYAVGRLGISDPVSTLAIFQELHVDPTLFYIVFGESVLNDAVGIVLFTTFAKFVGFTYTASSTLFALLDFVLVFVGSTLVGVLLGLLSALLFKHFDFKKCTLHEVGAYVLFSYLPFLVSTAIDMSGVVSILFAGITMKHYTHNNISAEAQDLSLAHLTETIVFLNLGLTLFSVTHGYHVGLVACSVLFCFLGRAMHVYPISKYLNRSLAEPLTRNQQHMLWFSGLRGAVAYALASSFPGAHRDYIVATTMAIVLLTVFFMGGSTVAMLEKLQIARLSPDQEAALDRSVRPIDRMPLLQLDAKYLVPFFTKLHSGSSSSSSKVFSFERSDLATPVDDDNVDSFDASIAATDCVRLAKGSSPKKATTAAKTAEN
ncbi:hypothetical protein PybrP1_003256 [[Pythium] brassicae (nom. inval.)]|nr:hypothetical protein PybrP1_003256 [[Pythium] brassicae (nom. inval.)]